MGDGRRVDEAPGAEYVGMRRYYDIGKAWRRLGYEPIVGLQEGIERSVKWFEEERRREAEKKGN